MLGIVVSHADSASEHVGEHLLSLADWEETEDETRAGADGGGTVYRRSDTELRTFEALHLDIEGAERAFEADLDCLVFASRHAGETGALLTAHFTGNFGPADHGGAPNSFARAAPNAQKRVVEALDAHAPEGYDVGIECTHHGPSDLSVPSMFVELGSGEAQWDDPAGAAAVARAILDITDVAADAETDSENGGDTHRQVVGFGGGHYAPRFERVVRETAWAVGHIGADWGLDAMGAPSKNREVIERVFDASAAEYALIEADRPELREVVEDLGYRAVSETWVREVDDAPLALVEALESELSTVEDGLRLGDRLTDLYEDASDADSEPADAFEVVSLPEDLLETTQGIDAEAVRSAVEREMVAFETVQGGSRARGRAAVADESDRETLVESLMDVLADAYDSVEREDGGVLARKTAFDPEKARTLGVSEGPAFGKLSAGQSVEVDGREIDPEAVRSERVERFDG